MKSIIICVLDRQKQKENNREMKREGGRVVSGDSYIIYFHLCKGSGGRNQVFRLVWQASLTYRAILSIQYTDFQGC